MKTYSLGNADLGWSSDGGHAPVANQATGNGGNQAGGEHVDISGVKDDFPNVRCNYG